MDHSDDIYRALKSGVGFHQSNIHDAASRIIRVISSINSYDPEFGSISVSVYRSPHKDHPSPICDVYVNYGIELVHVGGRRVPIPSAEFCGEPLVRMEMERISTSIPIRPLEVKIAISFCDNLNFFRKLVKEYIDSKLEEATRLATSHRERLDKAALKKYKVGSLRALRVHRISQALHGRSILKTKLDGLSIVKLWHDSKRYELDLKCLDKVLLNRVNDDNLEEIAEEFDEAIKLELINSLINS